MILGAIVVSGCVNSPINQTNSNETAITGHFENQYIKFELPDGISAKETSNDTSFDIILYKNGADIGEISSTNMPPQALDALEGNNTTFAGKKAILSNDDFGSLLYIKIRNDSNGNNIGIRIELDPGYQNEFEYIKNSFVIKKSL